MNKYVNTNELACTLVQYGAGVDFINEVAELILKTPGIDLVRCGECMHNGSFDSDCPFGWRNGEWNMPRPCDFCSYGEREGES